MVISAARPSAFESSYGNSFDAAIGWMTSTLLGTVAVSLCVIAVAIVGLSMLSGRLPVRRGARVVLGCFVLLGAPAIAAGLSGLWQGSAPPPPAPVAAVEVDPRGDLPLPDYSPQVEASLGQE